MNNITLPKWHLELDRFKAFKNTFILKGNIYDLHSYPVQTAEGIRWDLLKLDSYLYRYLKENGYKTVIYYNPIDGFYNEFTTQDLSDFLRLAKDKQIKEGDSNQANDTNNKEEKVKTKNVTLDKATIMIREAMDNRQAPVAIILNMASRYISTPENLSEEERYYFTRLLLTSIKPTQLKSANSNTLLYNLLFIVCNKANDIPAWYYH